MKRVKREQSPWTKLKRKSGPKKAKKDEQSFNNEKKHALAASDKGSWFDQPAAAAESQPSSSKEIGASSIKILSLQGDTSLKLESVQGRDDTTGTSSSDSDSDNHDEQNTFAVVDRHKINRELQHMASCRFCGNDEIEIEEASRCGLGADWTFRCRNPECSSHQDPRSFHATPKENRFYDINRGLVLGMRLIGRGHSAADRLSSVLNLHRPVNRAPWSSHTKALEEAASKLLEKELSNAALEVRHYLLSNGQISLEADEQIEDKVIDVGVSLDGSWSSRGWTARDGVVAAVSIDTGKVLDVIYLTNTCNMCEQKERERNEGLISRIDYFSWHIQHEDDCFLNHEGSAQVSFYFVINLFLH